MATEHNPSFTQAPLWRGTFPALEEIPTAEATITTIRPYPDDGSQPFVHGVALADHNGELWCSYAVNPGAENTSSEVVGLMRSSDAGRAWGSEIIVRSSDAATGLSHGSLVSARGHLYSFNSTVRGGSGGIDGVEMTVARVVGDAGWFDSIASVPGFWPLQEPIRFRNHWVVAGLFRPLNSAPGEHASPAVARSRASDFSEWEPLVVVPVDAPAPYWGECAILVDGERLILLSRYGYSTPWLLASESWDGGSTWSPARVTGIPFSASKPAVGRLKDGRPFLVGSSYKGVQEERTPLTILLGAPGSSEFDSVFVIDHSPSARLAYPHGLQVGDDLLVAYSDDEGRGKNLNRLQLARLSTLQWRDQDL